MDTENIIYFPALPGSKAVHIKPGQPSKVAADIEHFIQLAENKKSGQTIHVNAICLETHYGESSGHSWIEMYNDHGYGAIPASNAPVSS